jgi:hypothetical protein
MAGRLARRDQAPVGHQRIRTGGMPDALRQLPYTNDYCPAQSHGTVQGLSVKQVHVQWVKREFITRLQKF